MTADAPVPPVPVDAARPAPLLAGRDRPCLARRLRLPITWVLMLGFGGLMALAVASVLVLGIRTAGNNTFELLSDKASLAMDGLEARVRSQLDPALAQAGYLARMIALGQVDPDDPDQLALALQAALAPAPQIMGVSFLSRDGRWTGAVRTPDATAKIAPVENHGRLNEVLQQGLALGGAYWADPVWSTQLGSAILTVRTPVRRDGRFLGMILTAVATQDLSRFLRQMERTVETSAFILLGDDHVLAHPIMADRPLDYSTAQDGRLPLPTLAELGDPVAANVWQERERKQGRKVRAEAGKEVEIKFGPADPLKGMDFLESEIDGIEYGYLMKTIQDFGATPWRLVIAYPAEEVEIQIIRFLRMIGVGLGILVVSVIAALVLGKAIAAQIRRLAGAAAALRELDFQRVPTLPDSRFREIADATQAFNTMVSGLRWFETYVPKALVLRLIRRDGDSPGVTSEERPVTVLFTDVKGFSAMAESMGPAETAAWLNAHFTRIAACIEAEGGTVDKFIGDAVMAFWGAPEHQPDHAARALRAAAAIDRVIRDEAAELTACGIPPVCLRVGIHSGPVVVGNIGAASRINYTIVGDTVNAAARLEALGSDLIGGDCCVVLASGDTIEAAGPAASGCFQRLGDYALRGRVGAVTVWRFLADG